MASGHGDKHFCRNVLQYNIMGLFPFHYLIPWIIAMAFIKLAISMFNEQYAKSPLLTTVTVNGVLGGIADTVAQTITAVKANYKVKKWTNPHGSAGVGGQAGADVDAEIELDEKTMMAWKKAILPRAPVPAQPFDPERLLRFVGYGMAMAPVQFGWFKLLGRAFPLTKSAAMAPALKRMTCDQLIFAPFGVGVFFTAMTLAEGGGRPAIQKKLQDMYLPTLKTNWLVWPAVQIVNFRFMPVQFQLPFVSTVGIAWTAYLSLANATEDAEIIRLPSEISLP
ncbi:hypothetical protein BROUX41_002021 [Berkeleyomyces rouxiae]|uniref:uncharacterized protein n=1 Tax=Berkeleyomyces rouxiae TaxID=2035830 RepID=UPI003B8278E7